MKHLGEYADLNEVKCENYDELFNKINDLLSKEKSVRKSERGQGLSKVATKTSKYVGVLYSSEKNKWVAKIKKDRKSYHICNTNNEEDAAKAYDAKALELYGENATLNFPEIDPDVIKKEYQKILKNNVYNRHITSQGNCKNISKKSSKYVGVSKNKSTNKWESYITFNYKCYRLSHFNNEEDAARAYDNKALELYGKNAILNFPLSTEVLH